MNTPRSRLEDRASIVSSFLDGKEAQDFIDARSRRPFTLAASIADRVQRAAAAKGTTDQAEIEHRILASFSERDGDQMKAVDRYAVLSLRTDLEALLEDLNEAAMRFGGKAQGS